MNENVVFKEMSFDEMQTVMGSRRIKMKPMSMDQLLLKVAKFSPISVTNMGAPEVTQTPSTSVVVPVSDEKPENVIKISTLDNIEKENINDYVLQFFPFIESKPIRLTDSMYLKVGANALITKENSSEATTVAEFPFNTPVFDSVAETSTSSGLVTVNSIDTSAIDAQKIQDTVSDAFNVTEENMKKVGYSNSKAKVEKYNGDIEVAKEIPKFGHINDGIFSNTVSSSVEDTTSIQADAVENNKDRVVPIVAPVREEKIMVVEEKKEPEVKQFVFEQDTNNDKNEVVEKPIVLENSAVDTDVFDFAKAKAIIEEEKKKAASLDEKKQEEEQKLEAAVKNCNEQREDYKKVCQQVREEIAFWQKTNEDRQQEVQQLEEKRLQQEKIAADYAQQKAEITSLISGTMDYSESAQFVKYRAA